jgi:hypothetical protein
MDSGVSLIEGLDDEANAFYRSALTILQGAGVPFLLGGTFAFSCYTGIERDTKDIDVFLRERDLQAALDALAAAGCRTELPFPHWLAKAHCGDYFIDLIFNSGNGLTPVDDAWFDHAVDGEVLGVPVRLMPAEELLLSKAFLQERERYDGADVIHLLRTRAELMDWRRIFIRVGSNWRVLLAHLVLFGFVYPGERQKVPARVIEALTKRLLAETALPPGEPDAGVCRGTLISREQYLIDVERWGYRDSRLEPEGPMSAEEIAIWTEAIGS